MMGKLVAGRRAHAHQPKQFGTALNIARRRFYAKEVDERPPHGWQVDIAQGPRALAHDLGMLPLKITQEVAGYFPTPQARW
jgi:hypothetical protein